MEKNCSNCIWYGSATMVCFNDKNEGIRVFYPEKNVCKYHTIKCEKK